jgi:adenosylcobinamide-GDP ribazoletransferase
VNGLALAFGLLTAVPVGRLPAVDRRSAGRAMLLAPLTTAPLLLVLALAHLLVVHGVPLLLVAAAVLGAENAVTRGLHLDGLADTADGLAAGTDPAVSLRVMKASDIGPAGVVTLVLALLLQVGALAALLPSYAGTVLAGLAWLASRHALAWACRRGVPAASPTGLGTLVAGAVSPAGLAVAAVAMAALAVLVGLVPELRWWAGPVTLVVTVAAALFVVRHCTARLGGVTGDVLGAVVEVALTAGLTAAAVALTLHSGSA